MRVSIVLPVIDETESLQRTVDTLVAENAERLGEILIVTCKKTTRGARAVCDSLSREHPGLIRVRQQQRPYLGGAMRDAFEWASGSHVVMMASDLETDPRAVCGMIARAQDGYDIVTATRWGGGCGFQGYGRCRRAANWGFQRLFGALYGTPLSDLTFGFRIFKSEWVKNVEWEELRHPFLLETVLKPLRLGATVAEVPTRWKARTQGESHNTFWRNFVYLRIAIKTRFRNKNKLWRRALA